MNNLPMRQALSLILLGVTMVYGLAQNNRDFETWSSVQTAFEPNKKWKFGLEEQLRLKDRSSVIDQYFTEVGVEYELFNNFGLGGGLRFIKNNDTKGKIQGYENHLRFQIDAAYKQEIKDLSVKYRLRYQNKNELGITALEGDYPSQHLRFATTLEYKFKNWKLDPIFTAEIFNSFAQGKESVFEKYRLSLGTEYKLKKYGKIGLSYRLERLLNVDIPTSVDILRFEYVYTFKPKKKKNKTDRVYRRWDSSKKPNN